MLNPIKLPRNKILQGDCLTILKTLPSNSVDMVMTSPPYWALRDYNVAGQLGLEATFEEYISKLCDIFDEIKRVLKKEGTCWVNIGDTYSGSGKGFGDPNSHKGTPRENYPKPAKTGLSDKTLCMIPFRFSIEMVRRGWLLRNTIIWHKPNAMPESVQDRFTNDFEYLFFFVRSKTYYFDAERVAEPITDTSAIRLLQDIENQKGSERGNGGTKLMKAVGRKPFTGEMGGGGSSFKNHSGYRKDSGEYMVKPLRNKRTVWKIETKGYSDAHFAIYPEKLCETPILAGSPEGGVVLDPFMGSGTTAYVARDLLRKYIGIELNPDYVQLIEKRMAQGHLFA